MRRTAAICLVLLASVPAQAGGMWLPVRGVRSLARGGAFVAGADDADALWQNPAGLAHAIGEGKRALLFDIALVYQPIEYTALDGTTASNEQPTQPVPSIAGSLGIGERLVIAGGISAPYAALHRFPADGAARFASVSWSGSAFVVATVGVAYAVSDQLRVGATVQNFFSKLSWSLVMSGCPPTATCDDADRTYDMPVDIDQTDYLSPSGSVGVQYDVSPYATLGLALQAPTKVAGAGSLTAKLPTNLAFENGRITGDEVAVSYTLPPSIRAGVEAHPLPNLKVEAALDVELWSMHDEILIETNEIAIENVVGGPFGFGDLTIARAYKTSFSPSLGVEYRAPLFVVGAGYAYESAAAPASTVSPLTVDSAKHLFAIGGGYEDDGWQIGAAIAYVTAADVEVSLGDAKVTRLAPLRDAGPSGANAGSYTTSFVVAGLRFARRW